MTNVDLDHTFVTSDHHFGSFKTQIGPLKVFSPEEEADLIEKWNSVVNEGDTVLYVGDFHDCGVADLMEYRKRLNGNIILIKGNHDDQPDDIYEAVFGKVCTELEIEDLDLVLRHCPDVKEKALHQIFGHLHRDNDTGELVSKRSFCSCVMRNNGYPVSLRDALAKMDSSDKATCDAFIV